MHRLILAGALAFGAGISAVSAQQPATPAGRAAARAAVQRPAAPALLRGTDSSAFTTIQGNALTATDEKLADSLVRLREVRFGRIVDSQVTDHAGLFGFRDVDPGS